MRQTTRLLLSAAALACACGMQAETLQQLNVVAKDSAGNAVAKVPVDLESRIRFSGEGIEILSGEQLAAVVGYADMASFGFEYSEGTGVSSVAASGALALRNNPVAESLEVLGFSGESAPLTVSDLGGAVQVRVADWKGETVEVGHLPAGLYFLTVGKTTLKFIKK